MYASGQVPHGGAPHPPEYDAYQRYAMTPGYPPGPAPAYDLHTGDPRQDMAFEQSAAYGIRPEAVPVGGPPLPNLAVPEEVAEYLRYFRRCVEAQNVQEIHNLYEYGFPDLTQRYYQDKLWPDENKVKMIVGDDEEGKIFIILYKELYYRYLYSKIQKGPSLEHRFYSYHNYQDLFAYVLDTTKPQQLNLPNQWLWDIIDEFVYQFQSFCQYKANPGKRSPDDVEDLMQFEREVWNLYPVLNILYSLVKKSQVNEQLEAINNGQDPDDITDEFGRHPLYFKLGYFSLIGLLRLQSMLGDYFQALAAVRHLHFDPKGLYNTVPNCLVTLHYFVGFARMMKRQYQEAIRIFANCLLYIQRTRNMLQQQPRATYQYDIISKTNEQLYHMLAICVALQPQRIDESIHTQLMDKCGDRINRMQRGELAEFENAFQLGAPKFLSPTMINFESGAFAREPTIQQTRVFREEVKQQAMIPILRGYLRLYSTMPIAKLASFVDVEENRLISMLLSFKHKMWEAGKEMNLEEDISDMDFYIDKGMIHIADTKVARRYGEYFIRHIQKLTELNKNLKLHDSKKGTSARSQKTN